MPDLLRKHAAFREEMVLPTHHLRESPVAYVRDGVSVHEFFTESHKGTSVVSLYNVGKFPGAVFANPIPPPHAAFVRTEMRTLITRGCVAKWADVRSPMGPARPRMMQALSVGQTKPRLIHDAPPLNKVCKRIPFPMDTVARVGHVMSEGCFQSSPDDSSGFHNVLQHPASWPLFGLRYQGVNNVSTVVSFGCCESPYVYHTLSEAKATLLRSMAPPIWRAWTTRAWLQCSARTDNRRDSSGWPPRRRSPR